jgi:hypothetical protein
LPCRGVPPVGLGAMAVVHYKFRTGNQEETLTFPDSVIRVFDIKVCRPVGARRGHGLESDSPLGEAHAVCLPPASGAAFLWASPALSGCHRKHKCFPPCEARLGGAPKPTCAEGHDVVRPPTRRCALAGPQESDCEFAHAKPSGNVVLVLSCCMRGPAEVWAARSDLTGTSCFVDCHFHLNKSEFLGSKAARCSTGADCKGEEDGQGPG